MHDALSFQSTGLVGAVTDTFFAVVLGVSESGICFYRNVWSFIYISPGTTVVSRIDTSFFFLNVSGLKFNCNFLCLYGLICFDGLRVNILYKYLITVATCRYFGSGRRQLDQCTRARRRHHLVIMRRLKLLHSDIFSRSSSRITAQIKGYSLFICILAIA